MGTGAAFSVGGGGRGQAGRGAAAHRPDNRAACARSESVNPYCCLPFRSLTLLAALCLAVPRAGRAGAAEEAAPAAEARASAEPTVVEITTSMGSITLQLDAEKAPVTVANFLSYAASGHYEGTVFHRVVGGYMVQGGGFEKKGDQLIEKPTGAPIRNEADNGLKNVEGTIAMARTDAPHTATAQFFLNCRDNEMLDHSPAAAGYAVFGRVTKGLDVLMQIGGVQTGVREVHGRLGSGQLRPMPLKGVPLSDVVIESVRVVAADGAGGPAEAAEAAEAGEKPALPGEAPK